MRDIGQICNAMGRTDGRKALKRYQCNTITACWIVLRRM